MPVAVSSFLVAWRQKVRYTHGMRNEIHSEKLVDRGVRSRPARWTRPDAPEIPTASSRGGDIARATGDEARRSRHPSSDLQATDQVPLDSKAPLQLGGPTGEVAGEAASHEGALLAGALGADHLSG